MHGRNWTFEFLKGGAWNHEMDMLSIFSLGKEKKISAGLLNQIYFEWCSIQIYISMNLTKLNERLMQKNKLGSVCSK